MLNALQRLMDAGLGAASMTREKAEQLFDEWVRRGQAQRDNREQFVSDMVDAAGQTRRDVEDIFGEQMYKVMTRLNIPTRDDLLRVEAKIDQLLSRLP